MITFQQLPDPDPIITSNSAPKIYVSGKRFVFIVIKPQHMQYFILFLGFHELLGLFDE